MWPHDPGVASYKGLDALTASRVQGDVGLLAADSFDDADHWTAVIDGVLGSLARQGWRIASPGVSPLVKPAKPVARCQALTAKGKPCARQARARPGSTEAVLCGSHANATDAHRLLDPVPSRHDIEETGHPDILPLSIVRDRW